MSGYGAPSPGPLFDVRPISRKSDPSTSHEAEKQLRSSGGLSTQCVEAMKALTAYVEKHGEFPTTQELAGGDPALVHFLGRRLPDCREAGLVENGNTAVCKVTKRRSMTWRPKVQS